MVDAVVSFVVEKVGDYLIKEAVSLREVRNEVELLKNELEWMQCFIKHAEEKQDDNPLIHKWVSDVRDIAYDTEDVLDTFLLKVNDGRVPRRRPGFLSSMKLCTCIFDKGKEQLNLHSIGKEIGDLRKRIKDLSRKRKTYGLENIGYKIEGTSNTLGRLKQLRRAASFAVEENIVGFEDDANKLLAQLFRKEQQRYVISILGMGGLGKTTLARKVYRNKDVKKNFDCSAWVSVSQDYKIADLLLRLIKSFEIRTSDKDPEKMSEEDMERLLHGFLQERSYMVVIDDVWQKEAWESLKRAFPDNKRGSRVIITTRIKDVAERSDERTYVHKLRFLRPDESWQLFCEKAFRNVYVDEGLEKLGREMVEKCSGLPLAIVVLGGLLSTKKPQEWRVVRDHIWRHLRHDSIHISNILTLSFNDLPYQLKLCFLYLGLFPEDFEINIEKLIRLLVAEGLIPQDEAREMEDVAKDNMDQLINRSLIQVEKRCWGKIVTCRVHDLLRDLAIEKAKELNFIHIYDQTKSLARSSSVSSCRQQAVYSGIDHFSQQHLNPLSRSLLLFNQRLEGSLHMRQHLTPWCERFTLLRVLDIEVIKVAGVGSWRSNCLPKEIGRLIHLKYLGLRNSHINKVPASILNLRRLQTLDLFTPGGSFELPSKVSKLNELRHLIGSFSGKLHIDSLTNLQTLKYVPLESWYKINTSKLVNLRKLHIEYKDRARQVFTFHSVAKLQNLQLLSVELSDNNSSFASLQPLSNCPCLVDLRLHGKINELPKEMHPLLPNLECLSLEKSELKDDPMPVLEKLLNLVILKLFFPYSGKKLVCSEKGFPRLEILDLALLNLEEWLVEEGAMPMLRGLSTFTTHKLEQIPESLRLIPRPAPWECQNYYWTYHS
ncbi:Disease resistance protein [Melia azedarach]|uniref:Disease resistance protein n=1 Tax=Melia azedarach TaxID=155640 RepID=A0ACC1YNW7_MELAZ|nr:Disease resistance protein [Melia azedarach]